MRRTARFMLIAAAIVAFVGAAPAAGATKQAITITAITTFEDQLPDTFTAEGLTDCTAGIVENGPANFARTRHHGVFAGFKVFSCTGSETGFILRLNARFGEGGSIGTWSVVDAWGSLAGMQGAGRLTGDPIEGGGITDNYFGEVVL